MNDSMKLSPMESVNMSFFGKVVFVDASVKAMNTSWFGVGLKSSKCLCKRRNEKQTQRRGLFL